MRNLMPLIRQTQLGFPMVSFVFFLPICHKFNREEKSKEKKIGFNSYA